MSSKHILLCLLIAVYQTNFVGTAKHETIGEREEKREVESNDLDKRFLFGGGGGSCPNVYSCKLNLNCPGGLAKDSRGCEVCQCAQVSTGGGWVVVPTTCPNVQGCRGNCPYGVLKDYNGCDTCTCIQGGFGIILSQCVNIRCPLPCPGGHVSASNGCYGCACLAQGYFLQCPQFQCPRECPGGYNYQIDSRGCSVCSCRPPVFVTCPRVACSSYCANGYRLDANRCVTCGCNAFGYYENSYGVLVPYCPQISCPNQCAQGYAINQFGCTTCTCNLSGGSGVIIYDWDSINRIPYPSLAEMWQLIYGRRICREPSGYLRFLQAVAG